MDNEKYETDKGIKRKEAGKKEWKKPCVDIWSNKKLKDRIKEINEECVKFYSACVCREA